MLSPLELLNLYLTNGKSTGPSESKLYQKFNRELTWDTMLNHRYQSDLCPLLYYILTKTNTLTQTNSINKINKTNKNNQINQTNKTNQTNSSPSSLYHVSDTVITKLKALYHQQLAINLIQFNELDKILNTFEKEGICVIQLKGAELAKNYYPDQALRPMADIGLLVRKEDIKRA